MNATKLTKFEIVTLRGIASYTRTPSANRIGYSKYWTPATNKKLADKGLVEFVGSSVIITDAGIAALAGGGDGMKTRKAGEITGTITGPYPCWITITDGNGNKITLRHDELADIEYVVTRMKMDAYVMLGEKI